MFPSARGLPGRRKVQEGLLEVLALELESTSGMGSEAPTTSEPNATAPKKLKHLFFMFLGNQ